MQINKSLVAAHLGKRLIREGSPVFDAIVLHDTAGSGTHNDTLYLKHPGDGRVVSVDFTVEQDGSVYQLNPDPNKFCTFHAGRATSWKWNGRIYRNAALNTASLGIEIVQTKNLPASNVYPTAQVEAVADLCLYLCHTYGLGKEQITTHAQVITDRSRTDPRQFPFGYFWQIFNQAANPAGLADDGGLNVGAPVFYTVVKGDTLSAIARKYSTSIEDIKVLNFRDFPGPSTIIRPGQKLLVKR